MSCSYFLVNWRYHICYATCINKKKSLSLIENDLFISEWLQFSNLMKLCPLWNSLLYTCSSKHTFTNDIFYGKLIVPLSSFFYSPNLNHCLHLTSAGFICFKVTRLAYMQSNASDPDTVWNSFLMIYLLTSTIRSALGEAWNLKGSLYLFEYSFTPSSKFLTVNTRVRNQANLSPRTWSKRCDSQWKQNMMFFLFIISCKILRQFRIICYYLFETLYYKIQMFLNW